MGSFANSLHVKSTDAVAVVDKIVELLAASGWQPTEQAPPKSEPWQTSPSVRTLHISASRDGWVSVLDSDLMSSHVLVPFLAKELSSHAIFVFVNDSDSWSYRLADAQGQISEYDSEDNESDFELDDGYVVNAASALAQVNALMRNGSMLQKMQEVQARMMENAPPEIREVEPRIRSGQATPAEIQQYQAWAMQEMPKYMADVKSLLGNVLNPFTSSAQSSSRKGKRKRTKGERSVDSKRLKALRPLYAPGIDDEQMLAIFDRRQVFAEETLGEFLALIGICDFYANLSSRYLEEMETGELAVHRIHFDHEIHFDKNRPALRVFS